MSNPLVSVVVPTFNQEKYIEEAVLSAVQQDYEPLEVVVADDGSSDRTVDLIRGLAHQHPQRVKPIVDGPHLGITGNCNRALAACQGKYIAFSAGDDVLLPGKIKRQVEWLELDDTHILCGHDVDVFESESNETLAIYSTPPYQRFGEGASVWVREGVIMLGQSIMVRTSALPKYGYDARLPVVSDWKMWVDVLAGGGRYGYVEGVYSRYRRHNHNVSGDDDSLKAQTAELFMTLAILEVEYPQLLNDSRVARARLFLEMGLRYVRLNQLTLAKAYLWEASLISPSLKTLGGMCIARLPSKAIRFYFLKKFTRLGLRLHPWMRAS